MSIRLVITVDGRCASIAPLVLSRHDTRHVLHVSWGLASGQNLERPVHSRCRGLLEVHRIACLEQGALKMGKVSSFLSGLRWLVWSDARAWVAVLVDDGA